jgi:hypothetical protein
MMHDREKSLRHSSCEADEQGRRDICRRCGGADGAKGGDQEDRERAKRAPDTRLGSRDKGARRNGSSRDQYGCDNQGSPQVSSYLETCRDWRR